MDMDFTFPATSTTAAATTTTPTPEPPAVVVAGPLPAAACRPLPLPRFAAASSSSSPPPCRSPPSPPAAAVAPPVTRSRALTLTTMAAQEPPGAGGDAAAAAAAAAAAVAEVEDRMDLLWEDFNEELVARGGSCRADGGLQQARELWSSGSSDAESSEPAARGCAPVLRPSSRAAAVRHCRRRAGTWVLLMRIFRRLFVIEKTVSAAPARRQHAAPTTRAS